MVDALATTGASKGKNMRQDRGSRETAGLSLSLSPNAVFCGKREEREETARKEG